ARSRILAHKVRSRRFDYGIEMPDQQEPDRARLPAMLGHEMAGAADGIGDGDPARGEAERVERNAERCADFPDALEIERAARDVDDALQISDLLFPRRVDGGADALLRTIQVRRLEDEKGENEVHYGVALTVS